MDDLVVVGERGVGEEYLAQWIGAFVLGHDPRVSPVTRILRMLRYPEQHAIIWPDVLAEIPPLPGGVYVRLPVLRQTNPADLATLDWFRDYPASVRFAAMDAIRRTEAQDQRTMICLQLAGRRKRKRSAYILNTLEVMSLAIDPGGHVPSCGVADPQPEARPEGSGADPGGSPERRGESLRPSGQDGDNRQGNTRRSNGPGSCACDPGDGDPQRDRSLGESISADGEGLSAGI